MRFRERLRDSKVEREREFVSHTKREISKPAISISFPPLIIVEGKILMFPNRIWGSQAKTQ